MGWLGNLLKGAVNVGTSVIPGGGIAKTILNAAPTVLGGLGALGGAKDLSKGSRLRDQALAAQQADYAARAPLRTKARTLAMAGQPQRRNLSALFGADAGNPFTQQYRGLAHQLLQAPPPVAPPAPPTQSPAINSPELAAAFPGIAKRLLAGQYQTGGLLR